MRLLRLVPWRRVLAALPLLGMAGLIVALPVGYGVVEYTTRPKFCASCHNMEPYVQSWEESSHAMVQCVDCHYEPGLLETAEGKFKALSQLAKYITATEGTKPWAEVADSSCMRSGCHSKRLLTGAIEFDLGDTNIAFDHAPHLLEMRRSKQLRCTSCHSQIVQGEHLSVTPSTCFLCHFKADFEDPQLSECATCHGPPSTPIDLGGFVFQHSDYVARGVDCESCHYDLTQGTGEVPKRRCGSCHAVLEHIERYGETEFLHRQHVTDHNVDCLECHTEVTHRLSSRDRPAADGSGCARCHSSAHGAAEAFLRGEGGRTADATPSAMWLARVACTGCHLHLPAFERTSTTAIGAREVACLACHGPEFEGMLGRWQERYGTTTSAVAEDVDAALERARSEGAAADFVARLEDARHDVGLVRADRSRGVHNPWFARKLLRGAADVAAEAWARFDPARPAVAFPIDPPFETNLQCAGLCHMGIEDVAIGVAGTRFEHASHLGRAGDCDACHSTAEHGVTLAGATDCATCHHGAETLAAKDCTVCHAEIDGFLRGEDPDRRKPLQNMAQIACAECHGSPPAAEVHEVAQENCIRCHKARHEDTLEEWLEFSDDFFDEAGERLDELREAAQEKGGEAAAAFNAAEAVVERLRRVRPVHNVMLFDEWVEQFEELADEAEEALD